MLNFMKTLLQINYVFLSGKLCFVYLEIVIEKDSNSANTSKVQ